MLVMPASVSTRPSIPWRGALVATAEQDHEGLAVASEVDAIARAFVNPQLAHAPADRFTVSEGAGGNA
jgi:3-methyladenine DNA glycosylase AlkC